MTPANTIFRDLLSSIRWSWLDIRCKYRRSVIGPFWETINVFVMMMGMSYISAAIFNSSPLNNMPYVGLGVISWSALTALTTESTTVFAAHSEYIRNSALHITLFVGRTVFRIFIIFGHHLLLYFIGLALLPIPVHWTNLLGLVGIGFMFINAFWIMPTIGLICARFRDLEMIIRNLLQLTFFATPVFWDYKTINASRAFIVEYNPFFYFLEAIRTPLMGQTLPLHHYVVLSEITVGGYVIFWLVYRALRRNLAFFV